MMCAAMQGLAEAGRQPAALAAVFRQRARRAAPRGRVAVGARSEVAHAPPPIFSQLVESADHRDDASAKLDDVRFYGDDFGAPGGFAEGARIAFGKRGGFHQRLEGQVMCDRDGLGRWAGFEIGHRAGLVARRRR